MTDEHQLTNLGNWESRVPIHASSDMYALHRFRDDPTHLSDVVTHDREALGDLSGLRVVHLQCHIGTDTLSLARLGAEVTGVDFSPSGLEVARDLSERAGPAVRFVESSIDDVPERLPETFDLVYTGVGAINWLPSIRRWAQIVAGLLSPGGRLFLRDSHPMMDALDQEREDRLLVVEYPYFETLEPNRWETTNSYAGDGPVGQPVTFEWAHGLAEVVQAVIDAGLTVTRLAEHTELEWAAFPWMERTERNTYVIPDRPERLPLMFTLEATKPS